MTVRRLQADGDIATSGTQFLSEKAEVAQTIQTRLNLFLTEYFRNITLGTPWYQVILVKNVALEAKEAVLKNIILETPDVSQILEFKTDYDIEERKYTVTSTALSSFGLIEIEQQGLI